MKEVSEELFRKIKSGEGQFVEFKKKANHPEKIMREVVAFANAQGGHLFVGIDDNKEITGLKFPEDEEFILTKSIKDLCRPPIDFEAEFLKNREGNRFIHYHIREGLEKPYFAFLNKKHRYGKAFIRVDDQSIQASYEMRQILKKQKKVAVPFTFEETAKQLFAYLSKHHHITLSQFAELTGLNKQLASSKLINFALSGALKIEAKEGEDIFFAA